MKRADLKVGETYLYNQAAEWVSGDFYQTSRKAVLVDDKRYTISSMGRPAYRESPKGTRVLVDLIVEHSRGEYKVRTAVAVNHLRGPWEEAKAAEDRAVAEVKKREGERERIRAEAHEHLQDACRQLESLGVPGVGAHAGKVTLWPARVRQMAAALRKAGWTAPKDADQ